MRVVVGAALALCSYGTGAVGATCATDLPARAQQGALVLAHTSPGCSVRFAGRELRVAADGSFVFGIGRNAPERVLIDVVAPDGTSAEHALAIAQREYRIERVDGVPETTVNPPPEIAERIRREQARVAKARERDDTRQDFLGPFVQPVEGRISGVYGSQRILNGTPKDPHYGLDIAAPTGTAFIAPAPGVISFADPSLYLTGGTVILDHGHGVSSVFLHLSAIEVALGQRIERGERIGRVGATGRASGPHLHWGFNWFGERLDPQLLLAP
jgi:murein DD-endopeptidase MepM/ murein hydrolase activator NlpD